MNRFSDFAEKASPLMDGRKMSLDDIIEKDGRGGKEIIVLGFRIKNSKYDDAKNPRCLTVQFAFPEKENERFIFFSGSSVLMEQLETYKEKLPFTTTVKRVGKYYTFS
jgi:hypothetical protein